MSRAVPAALLRTWRRLPEPLRVVARGGVLEGMEEVGSLLPHGGRRAVDASVEAIRGVTRTRRRRTMVRLHGRAADGGGEISVLCNLGRDALAYWSSLVFAEAPEVTTVGVSRVPEALACAEPAADLRLLDLPRILRGRGRRLGFLAVPAWVELAARPEPPDAERDRSRAARKSDLQRIRRSALEPRLERGGAVVREFLADWYLPFQRARWGAQLVALDPAWMRRAHRFCEVMWIMQGERRLAGQLLEPERRALRMVVLGMQDMSARNLGAVAACYRYALHEAAARAVPLLRMGGARPVLSDGVLAFKRKWGGGLRRTRQWDYIGLRVDRPVPAVRALLARHPVVIETPEGFRALTDTASPPCDASMYTVPGLLGTLDLAWSPQLRSTR